MDTAATGAAFVLGAGLFVLTAAVVAWALYKTAAMRPDAMIAVSVSILTLVAIFAAIAGASESIATALIALAGTGLGALAGALRALFGADPAQTPPEPVAPASEAPVEEEGV